MSPDGMDHGGTVSKNTHKSPTFSSPKPQTQPFLDSSYWDFSKLPSIMKMDSKGT